MSISDDVKKESCYTCIKYYTLKCPEKRRELDLVGICTHFEKKIKSNGYDIVEPDSCPECAMKDKLYKSLSENKYYCGYCESEWTGKADTIGEPDNCECKAFNSRLDKGRAYLMQVQPKDLTVGNCFLAFGWNENGYRDY